MDKPNNTRKPLLTGSSNPPKDANGNKDPPRKRRFRRCKSAPPTDYVCSLEDNATSIPRSQSIFGNLHPSFKKVAAYLSVYLGVGTLCFYIVRHQIQGKKISGILDALYFCVVTMTSVGYGDLVPGSTLVKMLACAFVFSGMAMVALILSKAADYLVQKQESLLVRALHMRRKLGQRDIMKEFETKKSLSRVSCGSRFAFDAYGYWDNVPCVGQFLLHVAELKTERRRGALAKWVLTRRVTSAEFILYKLKEMGKITEEDISPVMEEFEELDHDQSGTLSVSDITLAQASPQAR
ncbi:Two-pore potassium channel 1-like protein [Drosera capensis]